MTQQAYETRARNYPEKFIVAAVWEPGAGVWFGSTVQGAGHETMKAKCPNFAPHLWIILRNRAYAPNVPPGSTALFHAEDAALFWYESTQQQGARLNPYPLGTGMYVYGFRFRNEAVGRREPYGGPDAKIIPTCLTVVKDRLNLRLI
jgi:hypothetical protein